MIRTFTLLVITALVALSLSAAPALAAHHEADEAKKEHSDKGKHKGHEKQPEHAKGDDMAGDKAEEGEEVQPPTDAADE